MSEPSALEQAQKWRDLVLLAEIGAWLHDLGKLSREFLEEKSENVADNQPKWNHKRVLEPAPYDGDRVSQAKLTDFFNQPLTTLAQLDPGLSSAFPWVFQALSLGDMISKHHNDLEKKSNPYLLKLLICADQAESMQDENGAKAQQPSLPVQSASVFGIEEALAVADLNGARQEIYAKLSTLTGNRTALWNFLQPRFQLGLGKTMRAVNDIRLDQHVWGVASRFKAFLVRDLLRGAPTLEEAKRVTFRLLTVRWNFWETVTPFARMPDSSGREAMLDRLSATLRTLIEDTYAIGNRIYQDDDGIHFMVADYDWLPELEPVLRAHLASETAGEVQALILLGEPTSQVTAISAQMKTARDRLPDMDAPDWAKAELPAAQICPVCHRRQASGPPNSGQPCRFCLEQRRLAAEDRHDHQGTSWLGEIGGERGQVALLAASFDLENWLKGDFLHTLFSCSPRDVFKGPAGWQEVSLCLQNHLHPPQAGSTAPRQGQFDEWMKRSSGFSEYIQTKPVALDLPEPDQALLAFARKAPSAGRLLRLWQTTETFLSDLAERGLAKVGPAPRLVLTLDRRATSNIYSAEIEGLGLVELYVPYVPPNQPQQAHTIAGSAAELQRLADGAPGKTLRMVGEGSSQSGAEPVAVQIVSAELTQVGAARIYTVSPNRMLVMVPAAQALEIAQDWQRQYAAQFGKVQGRLPFHVGAVFMDAHYPMFAILDASRRLLEMFDRIGDTWQPATVTHHTPVGDPNCPQAYQVGLRSPRFGDWTWTIPAQRGDLQADEYHPYWRVRCGANLEERALSLIGPGGRWVHIAQVQAGDEIDFLPNLFDFIHLDTVTRRLDARSAPGFADRRPHPVLGNARSPRPYLLERLPALEQTWQAIGASAQMTDSRLQGATALLTRKRLAWNYDDPACPGKDQEAYEWLVDEVTRQDFAGSPSLRQAILDGSFFDVLELKRHILKLRVADSTPEEDNHA